MLSLDANFYIDVLLMALYNDRIQVDLITTLTLTISSQMDEFCNTFFTSSCRLFNSKLIKRLWIL